MTAATDSINAFATHNVLLFHKRKNKTKIQSQFIHQLFTDVITTNDNNDYIPLLINTVENMFQCSQVYCYKIHKDLFKLEYNWSAKLKIFDI